ncbi:hypothetical protein TNCV_4387961 [Trichonephila clavipes]|nr:hypothetical protein TNCV_4387961 [Trichonephila clavipes]
MTDIPRGDVNWSARLPDLSPPYYFLLAYIKSLVYKDCSKTLEDIRNNNDGEIDNFPVDMLEKLHWLGLGADEACPLYGHSRMAGEHLVQCNGLDEYPTDDIFSRYWEGRR